MILDEPFDGLSDLDRESILELLKVEAQNKVIFVIDHSAHVKELFTKVIEVEMIDGKHSRIK